jgi:hypothetical protein
MDTLTPDPTTIPIPPAARGELRDLLAHDLRAFEAADAQEGAAEAAACARALLGRLDATGALVVEADARRYVRESVIEDDLMRRPGNRATWGAVLDALDA